MTLGSTPGKRHAATPPLDHTPRRNPAPPTAGLARRPPQPFPPGAARPAGPAVAPRAGATARTRAALIRSVLATALLAALAAGPAAAQTSITLVSNNGQADAGTGNLGDFDQAQAFTTGGNSAGYTLTGVDVKFAAVHSPGASYAVSIRTDDSGSPGTLVGNLTGPGTLVANRLNAFTTTGIDLAANTTYFLLLNSSSAAANRTRNTASDSEDSGGQSGWSIADGSLYRDRTTTGGWTAFHQSKKIAVKGYAKAAALVSNTGQTSGTSVLNVGTSGSNNWSMALGFTTGANAGGYTLSSVEVGLIAGFDENDEARVSIYGADASGKPESSLHVLMNPASITNGELNTFTVPGSATLTKETKYFVVVESAAAGQVFNLIVTASDAEDAGKATGWAIDDRRHERTSDSGNWEQSASANKPRIAVKGTVNGGTALSTDATLSALALSGVTLSPAFVSTTETYTATVANSVMQTTVTATETHSGAMVALKHGDDSALTNPVSLAVGANVIKAVVTAEDGTTTKTYMVTVTREAATITAPALVSNTGQADAGTGSLLQFDQAQAFTTGGHSAGYTLTGVDIEFGGVVLATASYDVSIRTDDSGSPGALVGALTGPATLLGSDLNAFTTTGIDLAAGTTYFVLVDSSVGEGNDLQNTASDDEDSGGQSGWSIADDSVYRSRTSTGGWTAFGESKKIAIKGYAKTGTLSNDATLSALALSGVTLDQTFVSTTETYTATVGNAVTATTVTATETHSGAMVALKDGDDSALTNPVSLAVGDTVIKAVVTAEDGTTMKIYMVTVTREAATVTAPAIVTGGVRPTSMPLVGDTYGPGETIAITVTFDSAVTVSGTPRIQFRLDGNENRWAGYSTGSGSTDLMFTYVVQSGDLDVNGIWLEENFLQLQGGTIQATADNTVAATLTYVQPGLQTGHKVDGRSSDATLSGLELSGVTLAPAFVSSTETYTATVANSVTETTVTATKTHAGATVALKDGNDSALTNPVALAVGANVIRAVVTAENTTTTKTYMVTVTREDTTVTAPEIVTNGVRATSTPIATSDTYGLGETIAITVTFDRAVTVDTTGGTPRIQLRLDGNENRWAGYSSGSGSTDLRFTYVVQSGDMDANGFWLVGNFLQLQSGTIQATADNTVAAILTYADAGRQDGHKVDGRSSDATLSGLALSGVTLDQTFAASTETYTATVGNSVTETTVTATKTHSGATVALKHGDDSALTNPVSLAVGANVIKAVVTAEDTTTTKTYMVTVTRADADNAAPTFTDGASTSRDFNETLGAATVSTAANIGTAVAATDTDAGDTLSYSLEGAHAARFGIVSTSGQLRTKVGESYSYEARTSYAVTVRVGDGNGGSDTIDVTLNVTDQNEPPARTGVPSVSSVSGSTTSLSVTWNPPDNTGRPAISSYDLRYREGRSGSWIDGPQNQTGTSATITGLTENTLYQVQVRATNAEGDSPNWSLSGEGRTNTPGNSDPIFSAGAQTRTVAENAVANTDIGSPLPAATDTDGDTLTYSLDGADAASFTLAAATRRLRTRSGVNYDYETKSSYSLTLDVSDGRGGTDSLAVTVNITNLNEPPGAPVVRVESATSDGTTTLSVSWTAPSNTGPAITHYDVQYREVGATAWINVPQNVSGTSVTIPGLPAAEYEVQVQAFNDEGNSLWSLPARRRSASAQVPRDPQPLQLALWTDRPGYRAGETIRLYRTLDPHDDRDSYRTFVYLERAGGGERRYLAPLSGDGALRAEAVDSSGIPAGAARERGLATADKALLWAGAAPAPGLWQFVMDLRPEGARGPHEQSEEERAADPLIRRAWAKFAVAERSQLLIRRGLDREVRTGLTLRSGGVYYLLHQLFVRDGATLTIEPGAVVLAWGRNAAIIVERGGRIVAEGTREAPVVLTCSRPPGERYPGCWGGLRILGRAPVTRLQGTAAGVLPASRPVYGGSDPHDSSGTLRYVRVEFAGAGAAPGSSAPAIGFYGVGDGTAIEHVQAHASLGTGLAFAGGTAGCGRCIASGSGEAGLAWERGWRGSVSQLYVQHGPDGADGIAGGNDGQGYDLEPRSLPTLAHVTVAHSAPYGKRARESAGLRLGSGSGVIARDLLVTGFGDGAIAAGHRAALLLRAGESSVAGLLLHRNGLRPGRGQLRGGIAAAVEFVDGDPQLRDMRYFANPDPRPKANSPALQPDQGAEPGSATPRQPHYIGAFGKEENWLEEWTFFGPESDYDPRNTDGTEP